MLESNTEALPEVDEAPALRSALADRIRSAAEGGPRDRCEIRRVAVPVEAEITPLDWVQGQEVDAAQYWSPRSTDRTVAAVGTADAIRAAGVPVDYEDLKTRVARRMSGAPPESRYYGGLRFDAPQPRASNEFGPAWEAFGSYRFVLPRFELVDTEGRTTLACNLVLPRDADELESLLSAAQSLAFPRTGRSPSLPRPLGRADTPDRAEWTRMVRWALGTIEDDTLGKVVLARRVALDFGMPLDPLLVLRHLEATAPNSFHFAFRPAEGPAFVGASPERLLCRRADTVRSEAVAGTRPRGDTPEADAALRDELLRSPKERREHAFVQEAIRSGLDTFCTEVHAPDEPTDLALARSRHLHAPITGTLRPGTSTIDLLEALHPTPAVGGVPTDAALTAIRTQEPFDRGWYAGPVGWIGPDAAEFAVALRSGLVEGTHVALFSGAGIVDGSVPEREWEEIEQKIGDFAAIMGLNGHANGSECPDPATADPLPSTD